MRIKEGFVLREVAGQVVVIATGEASKGFHGMIKLNATGKDIWTSLQEGKSEQDIIECLSSKYQMDAEQVSKDVSEFLNQMTELGFLIHE